MRKFAIYALAGMLALPISLASAAQSGGLKPPKTPPSYTPTPLGFSSVLCVADGISGATLPGTPIVIGQVSITADSSIYAYDTYSAIDVLISNGTTSGKYTVIFVEQNADASTLACGDLIIAVVPYAAP
jgi:hypothetical protein